MHVIDTDRAHCISLRTPRSTGSTTVKSPRYRARLFQYIVPTYPTLPHISFKKTWSKNIPPDRSASVPEWPLPPLWYIPGTVHKFDTTISRACATYLSPSLSPPCIFTLIPDTPARKDGLRLRNLTFHFFQLNQSTNVTSGPISSALSLYLTPLTPFISPRTVPERAAQQHSFKHNIVCMY